MSCTTHFLLVNNALPAADEDVNTALRQRHSPAFDAGPIKTAGPSGTTHFPLSVFITCPVEAEFAGGRDSGISRAGSVPASTSVLNADLSLEIIRADASFEAPCTAVVQCATYSGGRSRLCEATC